MRPGGVRVRKVRRPHQVLHPDKMARHHSDAIILKGGRYLAPKIVARRIRNRLFFQIAILLVRMIETLEKVRKPSDVVLYRHQPQLWKSFEHARENNFSERSLNRMMQRRIALPHALKIAATATLGQDMQANTRFEIVRHGPDRIIR